MGSYHKWSRGLQMYMLWVEGQRRQQHGQFWRNRKVGREEGICSPVQRQAHVEQENLLQRQTGLDEHHFEFLAELEASQAVASSCTGCEVTKMPHHGEKHHS